MTQIVVASTNPVKIECASLGFQQMFPEIDNVTVQGIAVPSGVSDQPMEQDETLLGATNRAKNARLQMPDADYVVGIEGGVLQFDEQLGAFAWIVIESNGIWGRAQTGIFYLPQEVSRLILDEGMELGHADDVVFGRENSKQSSGSIGLLTNNVMTRTDFYVTAVVMALIPFKNSHLTWI